LIQVTNEIGYQGKNTNRKHWFLSFCICFRDYVPFNLFIYRSIILYYERISNINYTLVGAFTTYLAGDLASKVALYLGLGFSSYHRIIK
jgi:hypothetical protein